MVEIVQDMRPAEDVVWDFYDTPLKAMRRTQLWRLADIHKIPYPPGCSKENLLKLLDHHEIRGRDVMKPPPGMTDETFWKAINGPRKEFHELGGAMTEAQTNVDVLKDAIEGKSYFEMEEVAEQPSAFETVEPETLPSGTDASFLKSLTWPQLKKEAKNRGLDIPNTMKRHELEAILNG